MRIVSLVPSLTETICWLGLRESLVGCTNFCIHPAGLHKQVSLIGGTKDPDVERIIALNPTHVVTNEEENRAEDISKLESVTKVLRTFPGSPYDVEQLLQQMLIFFDLPLDNMQLHELTMLRQELQKRNFSQGQGKTFLYVIWKNPYMVVSHDSYISRALEILNFRNLAPDSSRYPAVTEEDLMEYKPDIVFLSTEPFPFRKRDVPALQALLPQSTFLKADGQVWSWYGYRTMTLFKEMFALSEGKAHKLWKEF